MSGAELIPAYLDAVARKDSSVVDRFFHPQLEYTINGSALPGGGGTLPPISLECSAALPWLGLYRGRAGLKACLEHLHRNLEITQYGPIDVIAQGERGAAFGWFRFRALATARTADVGFAIYFEIRDEQIIKYRFVENTFDVANAFRVDGSWIVSRDGAEKPVPPLSIRRFTSSEAGGWSNSYLIAGASDAMLFDAVMLRNDATQLADMIERSGKQLKFVIVSHAHPDHFLALDVIADRFPGARIVSTDNVVTDLRADGPALMKAVRQKFESEAPSRLVIPDVLSEPSLRLEDQTLEILEFGEGESKHIAALFIPSLRALLCADLLYDNAHAYLAERHLESWLIRLDELESLVSERVSAIYPGHGGAGGSELIDRTRNYLKDFDRAVHLADATSAQQRMLAQYPNYRVRQFLTAFSLPAYFRT